MKNKIIAIVILLVALLSGILLIRQGFIEVEETRIELQEKRNQDYLNLLRLEKKDLLTKQEELKTKRDTEYTKNGKSEEYKSILKELNKVEETIELKDFEISKTLNGYYDNNKLDQNKSVFSGIKFIFPGIIILIIGVITSAIILKKDN